MKTIRLMLVVLVLVIFSANLMAQNADDYFVGQWNLETTGSPNGDSKIVVKLERVDAKLVGTIKVRNEKEIGISKVVESENSISFNFVSSSGYDVNMRLVKKDEDHITGSSMGMIDIRGERHKE